MPSQEKKDKVKQIAKWFDASDQLLVLRYRGLRVFEANELRVKLTEMDSDLRVLKNTLTKIALEDTPKAGLVPLIDGPIAVVFVRDDAAAVAKALKDYSKGRKEFFLLGGLLEGRVLDGKQVESFASLPSREVLLAQLIGIVQAPLSRMIGTVVAPARKMLGLFQALAEKNAAESPAPAPAEAAVEEPVVEKPEEPAPVEASVEEPVEEAAGTAEEAPAAEPAATEEEAAPGDAPEEA